MPIPYMLINRNADSEQQGPMLMNFWKAIYRCAEMIILVVSQYDVSISSSVTRLPWELLPSFPFQFKRPLLYVPEFRAHKNL